MLQNIEEDSQLAVAKVSDLSDYIISFDIVIPKNLPKLQKHILSIMPDILSKQIVLISVTLVNNTVRIHAHRLYNFEPIDCTLVIEKKHKVQIVYDGSISATVNGKKCSNEVSYPRKVLIETAKVRISKDLPFQVANFDMTSNGQLNFEWKLITRSKSLVAKIYEGTNYTTSSGTGCENLKRSKMYLIHEKCSTIASNLTHLNQVKSILCLDQLATDARVPYLVGTDFLVENKCEPTDAMCTLNVENENIVRKVGDNCELITNENPGICPALHDNFMCSKLQDTYGINLDCPKSRYVTSFCSSLGKGKCKTDNDMIYTKYKCCGAHFPSTGQCIQKTGGAG